MKHHTLPVSPATIHWGYFSKAVAPSLTVRSGDRATIETLTHHAGDDYERMIAGDPGAESVFRWTSEHKAVARRGAGPTEGPFVRGSGEGIGVHLLTGPVAVEGAEVGDILEVRVLDVRPRPSCNACHLGRCFGSNAAASWGFHYGDLIEEPRPREVITIFELDTSGEPVARAVYNYVWTPQRDRTVSCTRPSTIPACRWTMPPSSSARTSCATSRCRRGCISARWGWRRRRPTS